MAREEREEAIIEMQRRKQAYIDSHTDAYLKKHAEAIEAYDLAINALREQEPCEEHQREFIELVVEYINPDLCTYPEYRGKPYFSIKYRENGKNHIGFGTYKIEILSQWIKEYFISNIQIPEPYKAESEET